MKKNLLPVLTILLLITFNTFQKAYGNASLDHERLLKEMENSSNKVYTECLQLYHYYLKKHPNDVLIHIEKCKFIELAQYNDYEEYNPNQEYLDSCLKSLSDLFPDNPDILIYQSSFLWGEELEELYDKAEKLIRKNPEKWSNTNLGILYADIANYYYYEYEYQKAYNYILKATKYDKKHKISIQNARILIELGENEDALEVLHAIEDTTDDLWKLSQKAELLFELKSYPDALDLYNLIASIDSTYNNNLELANTLEEIGEYESARKYFIADTSQHWDKEAALLNLFLHDLKYQNKEKCLNSYNDFRDQGYSVDPLGIYRVRLFLAHPYIPLNIRDSLSILTLLLLILLLIIIPSVWILPIHFIGHKLKIIDKKKSIFQTWGLKSFWLVSSGYLLASFFALCIDPEYLYSLINSSYFNSYTTKDEGLSMMMFILVAAVFCFSTLYKVNLKILLSKHWTITRSIITAIIALIAFKIMSGIYIMVGVSAFDISFDEIANISSVVLATKQEITALFSTSGYLIGFMIISLLVPVYEEIMFRGVILDSVQRYLNFRFANVLQATFFALIHWSLFLFPIFFLFGMVTGILRKKSGGLLAGIVFHIINNAIATLVLIAR